jgi:hypothetical protein
VINQRSSGQANFFKLEVGGRHVSVDRLKPHLGLAPVVSAAPPVRRRPPATGTKSRLWRLSLEPFFLARQPGFSHASTRSLPTSIVILLWRKFICDKPASGMLINPHIVFTFTRQRWGSITFSSDLALLEWEDQIYAIYLIHLFLSSRNNII